MACVRHSCAWQCLRRRTMILLEHECQVWHTNCARLRRTGRGSHSRMACTSSTGSDCMRRVDVVRGAVRGAVRGGSTGGKRCRRCCAPAAQMKQGVLRAAAQTDRHADKQTR
ncbi:hypothetical protein BC831DRAFT_481486 [Entophlyctis helioformis]|nr:hypothetical protein BC831DRAFT_481486 [Entophlyctis helioformis]